MKTLEDISCKTIFLTKHDKIQAYLAKMKLLQRQLRQEMYGDSWKRQLAALEGRLHFLLFNEWKQSLHQVLNWLYNLER